ncbi:hypothetical protein [Vibrio cholerae]|uniref:Uncharacterized protein n=1 Tax=Vibrio cholerae serotype O1 biovar El Tor TaxID=686 RepID=A0A1Z2R948_VIBCE|nr:hypothetical protein [Vibrio cholerae O1 biovar El Tor]HAS2514419.1 hypothetical protein [Vibrio cholerae]HAS3850001.1 hypothetical protein [Vibrio cholerae]HAS3890214.1 hypothetical protein [Vibrio cholerae]HBC0429614.1 hypothetical protein [Vibrio cholerae]
MYQVEFKTKEGARYTVVFTQYVCAMPNPDTLHVTSDRFDFKITRIKNDRSITQDVNFNLKIDGKSVPATQYIVSGQNSKRTSKQTDVILSNYYNWVDLI